MSLDEIVEILALAAPFVTLDKEQLKLIGFVSEEMHLVADQVLIGEGDVAAGAYILVNGTLSAHHEGGHRSETMNAPGTAIGELALLVEQPRSATITATSDAHILFVPRQHFKRLLENYPELARKVTDQVKHSMQNYVSALSRVGQ